MILFDPDLDQVVAAAGGEPRRAKGLYGGRFDACGEERFGTRGGRPGDRIASDLMCMPFVAAPDALFKIVLHKGHLAIGTGTGQLQAKLDRTPGNVIDARLVHAMFLDDAPGGGPRISRLLLPY